MGTMGDALSTYTTQAEMSSFFIDKMGIINVMSYANGQTINDGATDATAAFVAAVAAAFSTGAKYIYVPKGHYVVSAKIATITEYIKFVGEGRWSTRIYYSSDTENMLELSLAQHFSMEEIGLYYTGSGTDVYAIKDLGTYAGFTMHTRELYIQDFPYGIKLKKVAFQNIDVTIAAVNKTVTIGFDLATDTGDYANGINLTIAPTNCDIGLKLGNGVNVKIHDKGFQGSVNSGVQFAANSSGISSSVEFDNVYFEETPTVASLDGTAGRNQVIKFNNCYFACTNAAKLKGFKGLTFENCSAVDSSTKENIFYVENCSNIKVVNSNITLKTYSGEIINYKPSVPKVGNLARKSHDLSAGTSYWGITGATATYPSDTYEGVASTKIAVTTQTQNIINKVIASSSGPDGYNWFAKRPVGVSFDIKASKTIKVNGLFQAGANFIQSPDETLTTEWKHFATNFVPAQDISDATEMDIGLQLTAYDALGFDVYICNFRVWYDQLEEPQSFMENQDVRCILNKPYDIFASAIGDLSGKYFRAGDPIRKTISAGTSMDETGWICTKSGYYFGTLAVRGNTTAYAEGDVIRTHSATTSYVGVCVKAGTTAGSLGAISGENTFLADGTAIWWLFYYGTTAIIEPFLISSPATQFTIFDDFICQTLTEADTPWILNKGTDAQALDPVISTDERGKIVITTGDNSGTLADDGSQIVCSIPVQADSGGLIVETRLHINTAITGLSVNFGLTDTTSLEEPFTISGTSITSNATDAACFVYDDGATTKEWFACAVDSDTDDTGNAATGTAPVADNYQTLKIEVSSDGNTVYFWINGTLVKTLTNAGLTPTVNLYAVIVANSTTTASKTVDVDYIYISHNR